MATKKKNTLAVIIFTLLGMIAGVVIGLFSGCIFLTSEFIFKLNGDSVIQLDNGQAYQEEGIVAYAYGIDYSKDCVINGIVDVNTDGNYLLTYTINQKPIDKTLTRLVIVGESDAEGLEKEFYLNGKSIQYLHVGDEYVDLGVVTNAEGKINILYFDEYGINVSSIDTSKAGNYIVKYTINLNSKNYTIIRTVKIIPSSEEIPTMPDEYNLVLLGNSQINILLNSEYEEKGFVATKNGEKINENILIEYYLLDTEGNQSKVDVIDTSNEGKYIVKYILKYDDKVIEKIRSISVTNANKLGNDNLSIHFLELGIVNTGDSIYIKAGENDILIDAGSRQASAVTLTNYIDKYCTDGKLEYVIATHADQDHIAGFYGNANGDTRTGILYYYDIDTLIDFPLTNKTTKIYNNYRARVNELKENEEITHYNALECYNNENGAKRVIELGEDLTMEVLTHRFYYEKTSDENNYSVCLLFRQGENNYLFTGDLEAEGEESLVQMNDLPEVEVYKGGHHGSKTSSTDVLLSVIKPKIVCVCCCAGSVEYTQNFDNTFPTQEFINRVSKYTDRIYVTTMATLEYDSEKEEYKDKDFSSLNGTIIISTLNMEVQVNCSNTNTILKDTEWFKENRVWPEG